MQASMHKHPPLARCGEGIIFGVRDAQAQCIEGRAVQMRTVEARVRHRWQGRRNT